MKPSAEKDQGGKDRTHRGIAKGNDQADTPSSTKSNNMNSSLTVNDPLLIRSDGPQA